MFSVVIPSYNRKDCVLRLLSDLRLQRGADFEVIVVDDCSSDDTVEAIRRDFPEVTLLRNEKNGGPCVSRNRGILAATGEFIVGLDSDVTVPDSHLIAKVERAFMDHPDATGFAFRLLKPGGVTDDRGRWWHPVPMERFASSEFETCYFSGTAYAFRRDAMIAAGLYPETLFMHYEEVELAFRILDAGGRIQYSPNLFVEHHEHPVSRRNRVQTYYKPRNQILLAIGCLPLASAAHFLIPRLPYQLVRSTLGGYPHIFASAVVDAIANIPQRFRERKPISIATISRIRKLRWKSEEESGSIAGAIKARTGV